MVCTDVEISYFKNSESFGFVSTSFHNSHLKRVYDHMARSNSLHQSPLSPSKEFESKKKAKSYSFEKLEIDDSNKTMAKKDLLEWPFLKMAKRLVE